MSRRFLRRIHADSYGGLEGRMVGPFEPGMNVVYGPNEAGKSTLASLIGGVLFGWEEAHGVRNTYHPPEGARAARLEWESCEPGRGAGPGHAEADRFVLQRDEDGAVGDASVADDIDRLTFDALFSLTADELRSLRGSSDITARLLSAGSGTNASPASVFVEIEQRIVAATSGILQCEEQLEGKRLQVKAASEREALLLQEDRELRELATTRQATAERIDMLNGQVEDLAAWRSELDAIDQRAQRCRRELDGLSAELDERAVSAAGANGGHAGTSPIDPRLLELDSAEDRVLRDRLDELTEQREKLERVADVAKENSATSTAAYEALMELSEEDVAASRSLRNRSSQAVVSVLLPIVFIAVGIPLFVHGREITSLSFTALGIGLVVIAIFLAAAAFVVLFRLPRESSPLESRRQDAQWVMLQDRKKYDACLSEKAQFEAEAGRFFDEVGLSAANGSIRQARTLLDEAAARRAEIAAESQRVSSLELRLNAARKEQAELVAARMRIVESAGLELPSELAPATSARELDALARSRASQRDALLEAAGEMGQRFGELSRELTAARADRSYDRLKLEQQQLRTRLREYKHELMELLLAKRMLERSITAWEGQSQPEVYAQAGRLLSLITDGKWVSVGASPTGSLVVVGDEGTERDPRHLSLGTCQQLYLSLRIALLLVADDVGSEIPVLADDILVNFDATRRAGAARVLAELARARQVILFTCHPEVAALFPDANRIDL